ncbi:MAG: Rnf-Nqr domain containing protein [Erysipelotrichaceae bacterium]
MCKLVKNPVVTLFLAAVLVVGCTASLKGAVALVVALLITLVLAALVLSALNKILTKDIRLLAIIIVTVTASTVASLLVNAFLPTGYKLVSTYLAVLAVDLSVFVSVRNNSKLPLSEALLNSLKTAIYYAVCILAVGFVREFLGSGSIYGYSLDFMENFKLTVLQSSFGGYLLLAFALALVNDKQQSQQVCDEVFSGCCCNKEGE